MSFSFRVIVKVVLAHLICDVSAALKSAMCPPSTDTWFGHGREGGQRGLAIRRSVHPAHGISRNTDQERDIFDDWPTGTHEGVVAAAEGSLRADPQWQALEQRARWISEGVFTANIRTAQRQAAERAAMQPEDYGRPLDFVQSDALADVFRTMRRERALGIRQDFTVPEG